LRKRPSVGQTARVYKFDFPDAESEIIFLRTGLDRRNPQTKLICRRACGIASWSDDEDRKCGERRLAIVPSFAEDKRPHPPDHRSHSVLRSALVTAGASLPSGALNRRRDRRLVIRLLRSPSPDTRLAPARSAILLASVRASFFPARREDHVWARASGRVACSLFPVSMMLDLPFCSSARRCRRLWLSPK